jgi:hypothetical protein
MTKSKIQIAILTLGFFSLGLGIWAMLQIPTVILPSWYLVLIFLTITFSIALGLGFLTKILFKLHWHTLTITSIIMTITCLTFYISEFKPSYIIYIPDNYVGEVKLLVSKEKDNDFNINEFGIGYINQKTFKNGFRPTVIKDKENITKQIKNYSRGVYGSAGTLNIYLDYVTFIIPSDEESLDIISFDELINNNAIDTTRLHRR